MTTVHYFYDPMCGWCYGATALINELQQQASQQSWQLQLHPGGMIPRRTIDNSFRQHILQADQRIGELTGAQFGDLYKQRVSSNQPLVLDSLLTTQAILSGRELGLDEFSLLKVIQQAHYQYGLDVSDADILQQLALQLALQQGIQLTATDWQTAMSDSHERLGQALQASRQLMGKLGVQGFPTLLLETDTGWQRLNHSQYYGKPEEWKEVLNNVPVQ
ncbi:DsbA family protein [Oceanobacter mangrovi]|uniref:DsbA family protein n=1 Tax=Oceanobacter mangrovi TaxID=2862510 RepID=UPI001C8D6AC6|nr:DsbA family protein [Oceanobacter mangrovi]